MGIGRHVEVTARHREIGFVCAEPRKAIGGAVGRDHRKPDRAFVPGESLRQGLDQLLVVTAGRPNGDAQHFRAKRKIERACGGDENEDAGKQDEER